MARTRFRSEQETSRDEGASFVTWIEAARPYLAALVIVTILLSIWIGVRTI